jgi:DNA-binding XRE family transcriptional regulator
MEKAGYNRIKAVLAEKGITSKDLAEALGVNKDTVSSWCVQRKQPSIEIFFAIADVLEVDVRSLFIPNENSPSKNFKF